MSTRSAARLLGLSLLAAACETAVQSPVATPAPAAAAPLTVLDPAYSGPLEALAGELERERNDLHLPGLALAIVKDDRIVFARGFGLADIEHEVPVTPETLFAVGSTTKAFTATLVGMLADEGKLALDDPVARHLPWFTLPIQAQEGEQATLRDLLAHRTGFARMDLLWAGATASPEEVLRTAMRAEPLAEFRQEFLYNNIMFLAAGEACAAVAGSSWEELVRARIFEPLGMRDSDTSVAVAQRDLRLALGYQWDEDTETFERRPMRVLSSIAPAGAINSNVLDMAQWVRFQLGRGQLEGRRLLSEGACEETWKPHNTIAPGVRYGLGWMLHEWQGQPYVEHGGNIDGFAAEVALLPEAGLGVVMLANVSATPLQGTIGPQVFGALLGEATAAAEPSGQEDFGRYTGTYIANYFQFHDAPFEVLVRNDRLAIDVPGQMVFELLPPGPDGKRPFAALPEQIQASFLEEDGEVVALRLYQGGLMFEVPRPDYSPPAEIALEELEPYLGTYRDPMNGEDFSVVVSRNRLAVDYPEQMVFELHLPGEDERWVFRASDQLAVEFHLDADDVAESLTFHERGTQRECERVGGGSLALPTLEELLALRRAQALEARFAELGTCRLAGTIRLVHCGIEGTSTTVFDPSGRYLEETDLSPFARTRTAFDGDHVWFDSSLQPFQELLGKSRDQGSAGSPAVFFGDWSARFDSAVVERVDEVQDRSSARVKLTKGSAPPWVVHVDLASGDLLRAEVEEIVDGIGTLPKTVTFEDWGELEGLRLPRRVITEDEATGRVVVEYRSLETGLAEQPGLFVLEPD